MKIKLLYILTELEVTNGITSYVMNHYQRLDHTKFSVDFLIAKGADTKYLDIIKKNDDRVLQAPRISVKHYAKFLKHAKDLFNQTKYDVVHSHEFNWGMPYMREAKRHGVAVRIFHAHSTRSSNQFIKRMRNGIFIPKTIKSANELFACSQIAGESFFKKKPFYLAHNAINKDLFLFNEKNREDVREEIGIDKNTKLVGFFGRFSEEKNTVFLLSIFKELMKSRSDFHLLLIGSGALQEEIFNIIKEDDLEDVVTVLDAKTDIYRYYSAIDLFMLPSLYEGLPVVGVEALFNNVNQLYSDAVTKELNLIDSIKYLDLKEDITRWIYEVINLAEEKRDRKQIDLAKLANYDIDIQAKKIENKYIELLEKYKK